MITPLITDAEVKNITHLRRARLMYGLLFVAYLLAFGFSFLPDFGYLSKGTGCLVQNNQRTAAYSQNKVYYPGNNATSTCGNYMCVTQQVNSTYSDLDGYVIAAFTTGFSVYLAAAVYMLSASLGKIDIASEKAIFQKQKHDLVTSMLINIMVPLLTVPMVFFLGANTVFDSYVFPLVVFLHLYVYSIGDWHEYDHAMYIVNQTIKAIKKKDVNEDVYVVDTTPKSKNSYPTYKWMFLSMRFIVPWIVFALIVYVISISFSHDVFWNTSPAKHTIDAVVGCFFSIIILNILYYQIRTVLNVVEDTVYSKDEDKQSMQRWSSGLTLVWIFGINALIIAMGIETLYMVASGCKFSHY
jgi:hypothetical protein